MVESFMSSSSSSSSSSSGSSSSIFEKKQKMKEQAKQIDNDINRIEKEFGGVANNYFLGANKGVGRQANYFEVLGGGGVGCC